MLCCGAWVRSDGSICTLNMRERKMCGESMHLRSCSRLRLKAEKYKIVWCQTVNCSNSTYLNVHVERSSSIFTRLATASAYSEFLRTLNNVLLLLLINFIWLQFCTAGLQESSPEEPKMHNGNLQRSLRLTGGYGWKDGWLGFNGILRTQVVAISYQRPGV